MKRTFFSDWILGGLQDLGEVFGVTGPRPKAPGRSSGSFGEVLAGRFKDWDVDRDGQLSRDERRTAAGTCRTPEERAALGLLRELGSQFELDKWETWSPQFEARLARQRALQPLEDRFIGFAEKSFDRWDRDGDGSLDSGDLTAARPRDGHEKAVLETLAAVRQLLAEHTENQHQGIRSEHLRMMRGLIAIEHPAAGRLYQRFAARSEENGVPLPALPAGMEGTGLQGMDGSGARLTPELRAWQQRAVDLDSTMQLWRSIAMGQVGMNLPGVTGSGVAPGMPGTAGMDGMPGAGGVAGLGGFPAMPGMAGMEGTGGTGTTGMGADLGAAGAITNNANQAAILQMILTDMQQAQTIYTQIAADAQKQRAERWKIMQDTQTKIFEITQDVTVNKAKTVDKGFNAWDQYIRS